VLDRPIRLNHNENAYGPSSAAMTAIRETTGTAASRYPDGAAEALRKAIAGHHGVPLEWVVLGCGSSEILRAAIDVFAGTQRKLIAATPTFGLVGEYAQRAGAQVVGVPLNQDYAHDLEAMRVQTTADTGLIYIANPNNPTGTLTERADLEAFLRSVPATTVVVIDEAYHHYVGDVLSYSSFIDRPVQHARVIVTRTFSKIHGLAGLRAGYAVAAPEIVRQLVPRLLADGVGIVAARAAGAALEDEEHIRKSIIRNTDDKQEFFNRALARMIRPIGSVTNFVMFNTGRPAVDVVEHFRQHAVLVAGPIARFDTAVRVSLGLPAEMREFWRVWDLLPGHSMHHL
jgi:histidinol-phosphate aminotransferase